MLAVIMRIPKYGYKDQAKIIRKVSMDILPKVDSFFIFITGNKEIRYRIRSVEYISRPRKFWYEDPSRIYVRIFVKRD